MRVAWLRPPLLGRLTPARIAGNAQNLKGDASRSIATICSSVNLLFRIYPSDSEGSLSINGWSEKPGAGHGNQHIGCGIYLKCKAFFTRK